MKSNTVSKEEEEKKAEEQAALERKAEEQASTNELAKQCRENIKAFISKDVKQFASIVTIESEINTGNDLLETNKTCNIQLNPLTMHIKNLEKRKQTIKAEQKKCQDAYNGILKYTIEKINESSEKSILEGIKKKIIALKDGDCNEEKINKKTWEKINYKIKQIEDIIQKKTIDGIQPVSPTINAETKITDEIGSINDGTTGVQSQLVTEPIIPASSNKEEEKEDNDRPGPPPNRPKPPPLRPLPAEFIPPPPLPDGPPPMENASFSFTKIFEDKDAQPSGIVAQAAGHAGTFIKYKPKDVIWTGKAFFNNGESSQKKEKKPKKQCGGNPFSSEKCSIKNMVGDLRKTINIYQLNNINNITIRTKEKPKQFELIRDGGDAGIEGSFNVGKYNKACTKENMIGILEKSIYELLHNNIDTRALEFFRENLMFKINNTAAKPNKYIFAEDEGFKGKMYFAIENPYQTVRDNTDENKKKPVRLYDCKIGKKTVIAEDKGKKATRGAKIRDKSIGISDEYGFRLEGVNLDKDEGDNYEYKSEMFNFICKLDKKNYDNLFKPLSFLNRKAVKVNKHLNKELYQKQLNFRVKPMFMFSEMFSSHSYKQPTQQGGSKRTAQDQEVYEKEKEKKHKKRQLLIASMDREVKKIKEFIKLMKEEKKSRIAFIGSSISITLNEDVAKINIFDFGHPWIYHNNRLLQYPSITDKTFQESCKNYKLVKEDKLIKKALRSEEFKNLFPKLDPDYVVPKKKRKSFGLNTSKETSLPCIFTMYVFIMQHLYIFEMGLQYLVNIPPPYLPTDDPNDRKATVSRDYDSKYFKKKDYMVKVKQYFTILHNTLNSLTFLYNTLPFITCDKSFKVIDNMNNENSKIQQTIKAMKVNSSFKFINDSNEEEEKDEKKVEIYKWTKKNGKGVLKQYEKDKVKEPDIVTKYSKDRMSTVELIKDINYYNDNPYLPMLDNPEPFKDIAGFINKLKIPVNWLSKHSNDGGRFLEMDAKNCINFFLAFYKFYTNPIRNEEEVAIEEFKKSISGKGVSLAKKTIPKNGINLWTFNINEIILNHTDYNRSQKVLGNDLMTKLQTEEEIYDKIHENYYNGLQSFCDEWDNWNNKDLDRIKKIRDLKLKLDKLVK